MFSSRDKENLDGSAPSFQLCLRRSSGKFVIQFPTFSFTEQSVPPRVSRRTRCRFSREQMSLLRFSSSRWDPVLFPELCPPTSFISFSSSLSTKVSILVVTSFHFRIHRNAHCDSIRTSFCPLPPPVWPPLPSPQVSLLAASWSPPLSSSPDSAHFSVCFSRGAGRGVRSQMKSRMASWSHFRKRIFHVFVYFFRGNQLTSPSDLCFALSRFPNNWMLFIFASSFSNYFSFSPQSTLPSPLCSLFFFPKVAFPFSIRLLFSESSHGRVGAKWDGCHREHHGFDTVDNVGRFRRMRSRAARLPRGQVLPDQCCWDANRALRALRKCHDCLDSDEVSWGYMRTLISLSKLIKL